MNTQPIVPAITRPTHLHAPGEDSSARLALDLAMRLKSAAEVADDYGITAQELAHRLRTDKQFASMVRDLRQQWQSPMNATERVRAKAAVMSEDGLVTLWNVLQNTEVHPGTRLDVHRHLSKLADVEPRPAAGPLGSRFSVTIMLPGSDIPLEVVAEVPDDADAPSTADQGAEAGPSEASAQEIFDTLPTPLPALAHRSPRGIAQSTQETQDQQETELCEPDTSEEEDQDQQDPICGYIPPLVP